MRRALVTGGSRGIGRAIAARLLHDGFQVALTYAHDEAAGRQTADELAAIGPVSLYRLDLAEPGAADALHDSLGPVDVLVNNGAMVKDHMLRFFPDTDWQALLEVDLTGGFRLARAFLPDMLAAGWGRVVQISSYVARAGAEGRSGYAAAKAGLLGLTRALARETATNGVTVNAVCPGLVWTERTRAYPAAALARAIAEIPLARAAEPEEVAGLVAFLASEPAGYITGQTLSIDGGLHMQDTVP